jgi:hypothetical protein
LTFQTFIAFKEKVHYYLINFLEMFSTISRSINLDKVWFFKPYFEHLILLRNSNSTKGNSHGNSWKSPWLQMLPLCLGGCCILLGSHVSNLHLCSSLSSLQLSFIPITYLFIVRRWLWAQVKGLQHWHCFLFSLNCNFLFIKHERNKS